MAITTYAGYLAKLASPWQRILHHKTASFSPQAVPMFSSWLIGAEAGAAPTTAAVPDRTTTGAIGQPPLFNSSGTMRIGNSVAFNCNHLLWLLCDRLSHQGGLSGTATGAQTTNLPTAALTRYTSAVGVMAGLEIYTQIGASSTTITASYTESGGTSGRTSEAMNWGNTGHREINKLAILNLQSGDVGVKSVESVTAAATTGTVGNFGVTLFKPIFAVPMIGSSHAGYHNPILSVGGAMPVIPNSACLFWLLTGNSGGSGETMLNLDIVED